ncbi:sugar O-acetyltransferase [Clostridium saudiense]|uniref:sugar O-acetyltransferase n=1 Tax=Clostridium saudiense TaxID=1414720 RepID=UPI0018A89752|nr:sugar O-acetyltransferase [Clostridium saudiense]
MSNKEKMLTGEYYISWDEELTLEREKAKDLLFEFNNIRPSLRGERETIIHKLFGKVGKNCWIESPFNCDYGYNITVGDNFYTNTNCCILDCAKVTIGNNVWIGPNVGIYTPNHAFDSKERTDGYEKSLPIEIGDNVWIGGGVTIIGGVKIGSNSIIGAGSVVTKNIPAGVIVAGNPAKVIREITANDKIFK